MYCEAIYENIVSNLNITEQIQHHLKNHIAELTNSIENDFQTFTKYTLRLKCLRENSSRKIKNDSTYNDDDVFSDTDSILSSKYSKSSGKTCSSSKNRRKHERKLFSLKEGNKYEEIALITALYIMITNTTSTKKQEQIHRILIAAIDCSFGDSAKKLQVSFFLTKTS